MTTKIKGYATPEGTARYASRFVNGGKVSLDPGHFRKREGLAFSSIGIGSYLGEPDEATDRLYESALEEAVRSGVNVIDSAINYRTQRSERSFGKALSKLISVGEFRREELIVCTKGGFIPFDGSYPKDPLVYFQETYLRPGILAANDVIQGCHAMTPRYLEDQIERSLSNLGVETIDLYYLHNPETQLAEIERAEFMQRLRAAFEFLEQKVKEGKIRMYGAATWNGFRVAPESPDALLLDEIIVAAREAAGPEHHFKAIQLPFNLAMPEAWVLPNQRHGPNTLPLLSVAQELGVTVIGSASLLQARLAGRLPESFTSKFPNFQKSSQCSLQFARSVPGLTTSLVGMKDPSHVRENLEVGKVPSLTDEELFGMFQEKE